MNSPILTEDLLDTLKDKHLILDANVFFDSLEKPTLFSRLFNQLKSNRTFLTTTDFVINEVVRGATDITDYSVKEKIVIDVIDFKLPNHPLLFEKMYELIKEYKNDGRGLSITDYFLGANLKLYEENIFLMTRSTTEFPERLFRLQGVVNMAFDKTLYAYGIYSYLHR